MKSKVFCAALIVSVIHVAPLLVPTPVAFAACGGAGAVVLGNDSAAVSAEANCDPEPGPAPKPPRPRSPREVWDAAKCSNRTGQVFAGPRVDADGLAVPGANAVGPSRTSRVTDPNQIAQLGYDMTAEYSRYLTVCTPAGDSPTSTRVFTIYADTDPVPIETLRQRAIDSLDPPTPNVKTSPEHDRTDRHAWVRIPTWLWTDNTTTVDSDPATAGFITVTAQADFSTNLWDLGDGTPAFICQTTGVAWRPGIDEDATDCSHTYTRTSRDQPGGEYAATATTTWDIAWFINGASQGLAGQLETETAFGIPVWQIQAVGTG